MSFAPEVNGPQIVEVGNADGDLSAIVQTLDKELGISDVVTKSNAATVADICTIANDGRSPAASGSVFGHLVENGSIGIIDYNGTMQVVGPGRYVCPNPRAKIVEVEKLSKNLIQNGPLTIVRVPRGKLGLAMDAGHPVLLDEGLHVRNSRFFEYRSETDFNKSLIQHGSIFIIRVPRGEFGLVIENQIPKLLSEGLHVTNSNVLTFVEFKTTNQPHLRHGTINLIRVAKGQVALVVDNNHYKFLPQGTHFINSNSFSFDRMEDLNQQSIKHGTITRFRVLKGEIGLAWEDNHPTFFEEGIYQKDSNNFSFVKCVVASEKEISLGSKKIITVWDGEVGVSFLKGKLQVLYPDRHFIESADHVFHSFLSTQQQCLHLVHTAANNEDEQLEDYNERKKNGPKKKADRPNAEHLSCETKDFVEIGIKADVFYRISDAEKVLLVVGKDSVVPLVRETSIATLNAIIRSTSLAEVAQSKEVNATSERRFNKSEDRPPPGPSAPMFFDKVHDEFISKLHDNFHDRYGIEITNIRIESFKIINAELAENISKQALVTTQTETQLANLASGTEIATAQQRRDADVARIKAEGASIALKTETDARNRQIMEVAKADAEAALIAAKAQAQALELKAEAEAKAIILKAEAESKKAQMLNSTPLGGQLTMFQMYANMVKESMAGVEKVIYLPADAANNPFSFMSLAQGNLGGGMLGGMLGQQQQQNPSMKKKVGGES
eukprot:TRINITY_DN4026_c0_g1_i1.p1 TRINITY_DN4026_c0_g1~~TRINITY_DN4026_c0_g1_i1.p1  ORF type:complete len:725 (+),score=259.13 TRINITY_DN4026_c0_g1_i1:386-2560(+)